uniref:Uncharacterized protein n=1 Tax=viral metagenome TaxID=1070528 RepID=A0A6C0EGK6_9ZZZZ
MIHKDIVILVEVQIPVKLQFKLQFVKEVKSCTDLLEIKMKYVNI